MTTYGMSKTPEYRSWERMKQKCLNLNSPEYSNYGGIGIKVCDRWLNFENFFADMGKKPNPKHSLDRIDNDGDYCPENCRWVDSKDLTRIIKTHGMNKTPEYCTWENMKKRCLNPKSTGYSNYGGRGIKVCDRWLNFENFFADMGLKPTAKHSLDKIDNNGNYSLENCRWATAQEQSNNKRTNRLITIKIDTLSETWNVKQWEDKMGYEQNLISERLIGGWSEFDAVMTPVRTVKLIEIGCVALTIPEWSKEMGFNEGAIAKRLRRGWSEKDAVLTPVKQRKTAKKYSN